MEEGRVRYHYGKNIESRLVVISNKDVADASFLSFHGKNIKDSDKQGIFSNIEL